LETQLFFEKIFMSFYLPISPILTLFIEENSAKNYEKTIALPEKLW